PFLQKAGLIDHRYCVFVAQILHHRITQIISNFIGTPHRASKEMLRGIRSFVSSLLCELPAILSLHWAEQPTQISHGSLSGFGGWYTPADQFCNFFRLIGP